MDQPYGGDWRKSRAEAREGSDWIQRELLLAEGIPVDAAGHLPLARHRWRAGDDIFQVSPP